MATNDFVLPNLCSVPQTPERRFDSSVDPNRLSLLQSMDRKWVNGTVLQYCFFDGHPTWDADKYQKDQVRRAFKVWEDVGIGLRFHETLDLEEAEIRIGFEQGDGSWSYIGRDVLNQGAHERTMNFGWDINVGGSNGLDTAIHEIGHSLGFPHEHQNPNAGIVWNEEAVYRALAAPPNNWSREQTYHNIIRKLSPQAFRGSEWDPDSIMHYAFGPGLIEAPPGFEDGLQPDAGLSETDIREVRRFYPELDQTDYEELEALDFKLLDIEPGEQLNFVIKPERSATYNIRTFGTADTVMALFEGTREPRYVTADDDSGTDQNALISTRLYRGRKYLLRLRLYWRQASGRVGLLMW